ncbi:AMP-binding enzyme family protein [Histomonas meleagridis]|uniref:AMP-binding enzyme family protein n=1 Tax=Histomonas meleagridis TaxID=135588 RepID=UPI00355A0DAD|nr:AMP-binding enzyme family protein [Histomonas meleagridis]KAH0796225.1 AMP-binding enzyme family protein [Histomonas meleagridis]
MARFPDLPNVYTMEDLFQYTKSIAPHDDLYGTRVYSNGQWLPEWRWISRTKFDELRTAVGSFLVSQGIEFGQNIGILSYSRLEWVIVQYACYGYGYVPVPIYDTFNPENINHVINHSGLQVVFAISTKILDLIKCLKKDTTLKMIIVIDAEEHPFDFNQIPQDCIIKTFFKFDEVSKFPTVYPKRPPKADSPAFIMYTSGTTGNPKGCVLTQGNFISTAASIYTYAYVFTKDDSYLSYLPLAHVYENVEHVVGLKCLGKIGFYSGSIPRLVEEIKLFKPTIIGGVARVFDRIVQGIKQKISEQPKLIQYIFYSAFYTKSFLNKHLRIKNMPVLDSIFNSVKEGLGGNVRLFVSGGSALSPETQRFLRVVCCCSFIQGYGLTESCSSCMVQSWTDVKDGNCGAFMPWAEGKLRSVDGFEASEMKGELYIRGPSIFAGYYKDEEATKAVLDSEGFFKTGDVFHFTNEGQFIMISRCKDFVKLSQGEYVSLQKLYDIYEKCTIIQSIYIHAGLQSRFLVAVVVPKDGIGLITEEVVLQELDRLAQQNNLFGFEKIKRVFIASQPFSTEDGTLTPSLKMSAPGIERKYKKEIAEMERM